MITFVTLGTHLQAFPRALRLIPELADAGPVLVQHGETAPGPTISGVTWVPYLEWPQLHAELATADLVVCHAGVGSTISALRAGKKPILLPRRVAHGEHVDDHQVELAARFEAAGLVLVHREGDLIAPLLARARDGAAPATGLTDGRLRRAVAAAAGVGDADDRAPSETGSRRRLTDWPTPRRAVPRGRRRAGL